MNNDAYITIVLHTFRAMMHIERLNLKFWKMVQILFYIRFEQWCINDQYHRTFEQLCINDHCSAYVLSDDAYKMTIIKLLNNNAYATIVLHTFWAMIHKFSVSLNFWTIMHKWPLFYLRFENWCIYKHYHWSFEQWWINDYSSAYVFSDDA